MGTLSPSLFTRLVLIQLLDRAGETHLIFQNRVERIVVK